MTTCWPCWRSTRTTWKSWWPREPASWTLRRERRRTSCTACCRSEYMAFCPLSPSQAWHSMSKIRSNCDFFLRLDPAETKLISFFFFFGGGGGVQKVPDGMVTYREIFNSLPLYPQRQITSLVKPLFCSKILSAFSQKYGFKKTHDD